MKHLLLTLCLLAAGCASYKTDREVSNGVTFTREKTTVRTLFIKGEANKINSKTVDGDYSRTLTVGSIAGAGDPATIEAAGTALGKAIGEAAATAAKRVLTP